ncbi:MAG: CBS domain-containing protein [bacterium]|nr:CBS domain-containing protein [bacterium]
MQVKDILKTKNREVVTATTSTPVPEAMKALISNRISCLPVVSDANKLEGIISDKDIFRKIHEDPDGFRDSTVGDLMSKDLIVGLMEDEIAYIAGVMTNNRIRHVPIVDDSKLKGLVSVGDIVKTQMEKIEIENRYLKQYIGGDYPA